MKCYRHPNVDAVGVCYECGRGLCTSCAISVRGRLYCQTDVDALLAPERRDSRQNDKRSAAITLASILFVLYGVGELALSILLMYYGVVPGSFNNPLRFFPFSSSVSLIDTTVSLAPFITGGILFAASMIGILSGDWLWSRKTSGAVLGFVQIAVGTSSRSPSLASIGLRSLMISFQWCWGLTSPSPYLRLWGVGRCRRREPSPFKVGAGHRGWLRLAVPQS